MTEVRKRPCASCPYRRDVPSGLWAAEEYDRLEQYDQPTHDQPTGLFGCHQADGTVCAGWVGCHGDELLGLRIAVAVGALPPDVMDYQTTVPLHPSGAAAAAHGRRDIEAPSPKAQVAIDKLIRKQERH